MSSPSGSGGGSATRRRSPSVYLRGGTVFIAIAVAAALFLTVGRRPSRSPAPGVTSGTSSSACRSRSRGSCRPVARPTRSVSASDRRRGPAPVEEQRRAGVHRPARPEGHDQLLLARLRLRPDRPQRLERRAQVDEHRGAGQHVDPQGPGRRSVRAGHKEVTFTVTPDAFHDATMLSPETPTTVNQGVRVSYVGGRRLLHGARARRREADRTRSRRPSRSTATGRASSTTRRSGRPSRLPAGGPRPVHPGPGRRDRAERPGARGQDHGDRRGRPDRPRRGAPEGARSEHIQLQHGRLATSTAATCRRSSASPRSSTASASSTP